MKYSKLIACLSAAVLSAGLLMGCGGVRSESDAGESAVPEVVSETVSGKQEPSAAASSETSAYSVNAAGSDAFRDFSSADGKEKMKIPETWEDLSGKIDTTGGIGQSYPVQVGSLGECSFLVVNGEPREGAAVASLDDYYKVLLDLVPLEGHVFSEVENVTELPARTLEASGYTAKEFTFSATVLPTAINEQNTQTGTASGAASASGGGEKAALRIAAVEGSSQYYQFCGWTRADRAENFEETFEAILDSFTGE